MGKILPGTMMSSKPQRYPELGHKPEHRFEAVHFNVEISEEPEGQEHFLIPCSTS